MPHGQCILWNDQLLTLHVLSDLLIMLSYYSIPIVLLYFVKQRKDLINPWVPRLFAGFILACGTTHLMSIVTIWHPMYWLEGWVKAWTALISLVTAVILWPLLPGLLRIPNPKELDDANRKLQELNSELEQRVQERTAVLEERTRQLEEEVHLRKQKGKMLQSAMDEIRHSNEELEQFAYAASHDLREPLRKISLFSGQILKEERGLTDRGRGYLQRVESSALRLDKLIKGLLSVAQVRNVDEALESVSLGKILRAVVEDLSPNIQASGAKVVLPKQDFSIEADPLQLHQLFQNIIHNALKYHAPEKPPSIDIHLEVFPFGMVERLVSVPVVLLTFSDDGIGFDPDLNDSIFQMFYRAHGKETSDGTGMGLALCRKIATRHHGQIWAEGHPGQGAVFYLMLPVEQPKPYSSIFNRHTE